MLLAPLSRALKPEGGALKPLATVTADPKGLLATTPYEDADPQLSGNRY